MPKLPSYGALTVLLATFFVVGFATFGSVISHDFVAWDDHTLIRDNPNTQSIRLSTIANVFTSYDPELYIPLTFLSYQIDDALGGGRPAMFHFTNLLLHVLNAILVTWLLCALLRSRWLSVALGLIFLIHPLNVEAVAWASARKDVLSALFFLASFLLWIS